MMEPITQATLTFPVVISRTSQEAHQTRKDSVWLNIACRVLEVRAAGNEAVCTEGQGIDESQRTSIKPGLFTSMFLLPQESLPSVPRRLG